MKKLGVIAGNGDLPRLLINHCQRIERPYFILAIEGYTPPELTLGSGHKWVKMGAIGKAIDILKQESIEEVTLIGSMKRPSLSQIRPDFRGLQLLAKMGAKAGGDDTLLSLIVEELIKEGFKVVGIHHLLKSLLSGPQGVLTNNKPTRQALKDIERGRQVTKLLGQADVGQAVIVQEGIVLGVEAVEGTDELMARCNKLRASIKGLAKKGGVLIKTAKPQQDQRVDLPTIGLKTVKNAFACHLEGIAVESDSTLMVEKEAMVDFCDSHGLFLIVVGERK